MACELCGSREARDHILRERDRIVHCTGCGFLYATPRPDETTLAGWYEDEGYLRGKTRFGPVDLCSVEHRVLARASAQERLGVIEKLHPPGRLLDVGCGPGHFLETARERGWRVEGIDISPVARRRLTEKLAIPSGRTLKEYDEPAGSFDAVTMWEYLEHVLQPLDDLVRAARLLHPGGVLALSTPNAASLRNRWDSGRSPNFGCPAHLNFFTPDTLGRALRQAGFRVVRIEGRDAAKRTTPLPVSDRVQALRRRLGSWGERTTPLWWVTSIIWGAAAGTWAAVEKTASPLRRCDTLWAYAERKDK